MPWPPQPSEYLQLVADVAVLKATPAPTVTKLAAKISKAAVQTIANSTQTDVIYETEEWDHGGFANLGANADRLVVPAGAGGVYLVVANTIWNTNQNGQRTCTITVNGTFWADDSRLAATYTATPLSAILTLAPGDIVKSRVEQSSGGNLDILNQARTSLAIARLFA